MEKQKISSIVWNKLLDNEVKVEVAQEVCELITKLEYKYMDPNMFKGLWTVPVIAVLLGIIIGYLVF